MWPTLSVTAGMPAEGTSLIALAVGAGVTLATAESLTGGLVCAALVSEPGASEVVRGGIVAYDADVKVSVLAVSPVDLAREGPVSPSVVLAMARGARTVLGADVAVATTGVAGPEPHGGHQPGTFMIAVVGPAMERVEVYFAEGDRHAVVRAAVDRALEDLRDALGELSRAQEIGRPGTGLG